MPTITNTLGIPLSMAVWLLHDEYDYIDDENYISVTSLMKPIRHIILPKRVPPEKRTSDVSDYIARALGHSIHNSIEHAWNKGHKRALALLGYPEKIRDRILVNPTDAEVDAMEDPICVYMEQRAYHQVKVGNTTYKIGGKFDLVADGVVEDTKSTTCFTWTHGTRDEEHKLQGSLYRWLDHHESKATGRKPKITEDIMRINYVFTDWSKMLARQSERYPQKRVEQKTLALYSVEEMDQWVRAKLAQVIQHLDQPEDRLPECTDEELWRSDPQFKFYLDPEKAKDPKARSTKNFSNMADARQYQMEKGGKGVIVMKPGEPKRCDYCAGFEVCTQKDRLGLGAGPTTLDNTVLAAVFADQN